MSGYCVWRGTITFTGSWATPTTNISRDRYMVFAKWSADNVTIEFDGSNIIATKTMLVSIRMRRLPCRSLFLPVA
jgi:hypothetical protein